ncbi:MAG: hypothetical protein ACPIOQ_57160, partial [Promethearchaeia archaeon]
FKLREAFRALEQHSTYLRTRLNARARAHTHTQGSNAVRLHVVLVVEKDVQNDLAVRKFAAGMRSALPIRPVANRLACSN